MILRFIDTRPASKRPRTEAVRALANDVEIVVDSSDADESAMSLGGSIALGF